MALSDSLVYNILLIEKSECAAKVTGNVPAPSIISNTDIILNVTFRLKYNDLNQYNIVNLSGTNIKLSGSGQIIGDKFSHNGATGEWGIGVNVSTGIMLLYRILQLMSLGMIVTMFVIHLKMSQLTIVI